MLTSSDFCMLMVMVYCQNSLPQDIPFLNRFSPRFLAATQVTSRTKENIQFSLGVKEVRQTRAAVSHRDLLLASRPS